ncbi:hypothetical protein EJ08DRAFT_307484 [Tothia fuscella]|uniref:Uncharacterized protein n=1 Tax=Tothia fuscella TaxID=1048955 RepID=A0A9P4NNW0_9PEZI|nr:hypothetical protein EJ08DRAFT_307484 [Tothia fuscella]
MCHSWSESLPATTVLIVFNQATPLRLVRPQICSYLRKTGEPGKAERHFHAVMADILREPSPETAIVFIVGVGILSHQFLKTNTTNTVVPLSSATCTYHIFRHDRTFLRSCRE